MAFENVNYGMIPAAQMQQQQNLMQAIGQGIQNAQNQQQIDMQRRQLDMKAKEKAALNYEQMAMDAVFKQQQGLPLTPQDMAAIGVMAQTDRGQAFPNPETGMMEYRPSPWAGVGGGNLMAAMGGGRAPVPAVESAPLMDALGGMGQGSNPAINTPYDQIEPKLSSVDGNALMDINSVDEMQAYLDGGQPSRDQAIVDNAAAPQIPVQGNPLERKEQRSANIDLQKKQAEQGFEISKEQRAFERAKQLKEFEMKLAKEADRVDLISTNQNAVPLLEDMLKFNRNTLDMPYAEMLRLPTRMLASDQAENLDLMQQNRLELAAPLAKELGVNPTDKDFQASLDRIVDLNASRKSRESQLKNLLNRIKGKSGSNEQTQEQSGLSPQQMQRLQELRAKRDAGTLR